MRHSKLEMTGRYTRPRAVDIDAAARHAPQPEAEGEARAFRMTGTMPIPIRKPNATRDATKESAYAI